MFTCSLWIGLVGLLSYVLNNIIVIQQTLGVCDYMFAVKEINEVHVVHHIGDLVLSVSLSSFQDFPTAFGLLFSFRNHQLKLTRTVEPAYNKQSASDTLKYFRSVTLPPNEPSISSDTNISNKY